MNNKESLPTDASIITTYRCCMRCKMCHIWKYPTDIKREIKPKDLKKLPQLKFINITGGEPFLRRDIEELVEVCFSKAPRVVISTAGYHVDNILSLAAKFPKIGIRVSIEGLSTINDYLRGRDGGFDRGMKTLLGLRKMGIKDIGFGITVSDNNSSDMLELYELAKNLKMEFATASFHNSYYFHKEDNKINNVEEVINNFYALTDRLLSENHPKSWFRAFFNLGLINYIKGNKRLLPCEAGTVNFFIDPYGEVYPCNGLEDRFWKESMGNIHNFDNFDQLWFGVQANKVRSLVRTCPKNCWMVGTAAPVMKKYIKYPLSWTLKNKFKNIVGIKVNRDCLPPQFNVGQSPMQGDLRSNDAIVYSDIDEDSSGIVDKRMSTVVLSNIHLTHDIFLLELERNNFQYEPGQSVSIGPNLQYHKGRDYSFFSSPSEDTLKFLIREVQDGEISPSLKHLNSGDKVDIVGPYGEFKLKDTHANKKHIFIASGVGIGPFRSMINQFPDIDYKIIHGVRFSNELIISNFADPKRYISCISGDDGGSFKGRVTDYLKNKSIEPDNYFYISGNPYLLKNVYELLTEKNVPIDHIFTEPYYAY